VNFIWELLTHKVNTFRARSENSSQHLC